MWNHGSHFHCDACGMQTYILYINIYIYIYAILIYRFCFVVFIIEILIYISVVIYSHHSLDGGFSFSQTHPVTRPPARSSHPLSTDNTSTD